jgi:hypothetical protein
VEQWRTKISEDEIRLAEARIADGLTARGYEQSGLPPLEVSPARARGYVRQTWLARRRADIDRYGVRLFLMDVVARKLGATAWQKRIRLAMDTVRQDALQ